LEAEVVVTNSARTRVIIIIEGTRSHLHHHQGALRNQPILNQSEEEVKGHGQSKAVKIFGNVWVGEEDARRLQDLTNKLRAEGLSRKEILDALQGERRKAEKAANRQRDKTCFSCRQFGHVLEDCPKSKGGEGGVGGGGDESLSLIGKSEGEICFTCGSTEHTSRTCKRKVII
jgi:hypothetical protein